MDYKGLSPSEFADAISVQRSNITHVLQGRNNPGFQFITKMLEKFPDINAKWLLTGEGEMIVQSGKTNEKPQPDLFSPVTGESVEGPAPDRSRPIARGTAGSVQAMPEILPSAPPGEDKKIESVVIFYTDQTFRQYIPSK